MTFLPLSGAPTPALRALGWEWALDDACPGYLASEAVELPEGAADELLRAADTLYQLFVDAIPDDLPDAFLRRLSIPENLWEIVRHTWADDHHWHLYGRFDLALTADGPKLLEFNADTATSIPETAVVQWASLMAVGLASADGSAAAQQANGLFEGLAAQFTEWRRRNPDRAPMLLLTHLPDAPEDAANCAVLAEAAREAGFDVAHIASIDAMQVAATGPDCGVWAETAPGEWLRFDFLFKLVPWEILAEEEPELTADLNHLTQSRAVVVTNPAYTLVFQSKALLSWLWEQHPGHPLLLETRDQPLGGHAARKPVLGREGQDVTELQDGRVVSENPGEYANQPVVYQRWAELATDAAGHRYQVGAFWAGEGCALGFRRAAGIITNESAFVPHVVV